MFYNLAILAVELREIREVTDDTQLGLSVTVHLAHATVYTFRKIAFHKQLTEVNIGCFLYFKLKSS